jgi:hypothetical protein
VASDVYALGATLTYAATGHAPYQGDTAMDVLARLATEPPDLSGLPDALTELVTACLERVPRMRPTSSAVLATLGDFTEHSYLPEAAMDLIREYQRGPLPAGGALPGEDREDTSPSQTDLPASYRPKPRSRAADARGPRWLPAGVRRLLAAHLAWVGWAAGGAALVAIGVIIGASLYGSSVPKTSSNSTQPLGPPGPPPPPPQTVCGHVTPHPGPALCMVGFSSGSADAAFEVRGTGFDPGAALTVTLTELDPQNNPILDVVSNVKPVAGQGGTFSFPISRVYSGALELGLLTVDVREPNGQRASTEFMVLPPGVS